MLSRQTGQIGIIGVGNLGSSLARAWLCADDRPLAGQVLLVFDTDPARLRAVEAEHEGRVAVERSPADLASKAEFVVLAVKPQDMDTVLEGVAGAVDPHTVVVSVAAGVGLDRLRAGLGPQALLFRAMPNLAVAKGLGVVAVAPEPGVSDERVRQVTSLLAPMGLVELLPERLFDAVTAVTGSGPGFLALVLEGLEDGAVSAGLPRAVARRFVRQMAVGTAALLAESGDSAAALKDAVASPGGTTIAGLGELEDRGVRGAVMRSVEAATLRGRQLSGGA
jgi:pyrroline-5-carboxylate reductase